MRSITRIVLVVLLVLAFVACDKVPPVAPSVDTTVKTLSVVFGMFAPAVGSIMTVGDEAMLTAVSSGGQNFSVVSILLVREDGAARMVSCSCSSMQNGISYAYPKFMSLEVSPNGVYAFARGHTLNAAIISANNLGGCSTSCYFGGECWPTYTVPINFEKSTKRVDKQLGWIVQ